MDIDEEMSQYLKSSHQKHKQLLKEEAEEKIRNERSKRWKNWRGKKSKIRESGKIRREVTRKKIH